MARPNSETAIRDEEITIDELLEQYNPYIVSLAWKSILRGTVSPENLPFAIDELAQNVRLKLWHAIQKKSVTHFKAYIGRIVQNEAVNILRRKEPTSPLPVNEEGELYQGHLLLATADGDIDNLLDEIEQEEAVASCIETAAGAIQMLPPRQQRAMICSLKDRVEDALPLLEALTEREIDIGGVSWPEDEEDVVRLKASLPVVRKKLHSLLDHPGLSGSQAMKAFKEERQRRAGTTHKKPKGSSPSVKN